MFFYVFYCRIWPDVSWKWPHYERCSEPRRKTTQVTLLWGRGGEQPCLTLSRVSAFRFRYAVNLLFAPNHASSIFHEISNFNPKMNCSFLSIAFLPLTALCTSQSRNNRHNLYIFCSLHIWKISPPPKKNLQLRLFKNCKITLYKINL